jgi:Holliday junction resolvase RusA-like endonuclease
MIEFTVPGQCVPKARARTVRNKYTGKVMSYTPEKSLMYANFVKIIANNEYQNNNWQKIDFPRAVRLDIIFVMRIVKKRRRWDIPNYIMQIADALSGICYDDDCQIDICNAVKVKGREPRTIIRVEEIT